MTHPAVEVGTARSGWRQELVALSALAWPIAATNLAQIAMSATDVAMMGQLGPATMAAGALGSNLYFIALVLGIGLLNAVAPMAARALGRDPNARDDVARTARQGLWAAAILAVPCWMVLWWSEQILLSMGQTAALAAEAGIYVRTLQWALLPFWCFLVLRSFISVLERPFWALIIGLLGVLANAAGNWCLMLGRCGLAPMGIAGSGWSTTLSSCLMLAVMMLVVRADRRFAGFRVLSRPWRPDWSRLGELWRLGLPMAAMLLFEVTIFNAAVFLMGLIGAAPLAAHTIAITIASLTFMVPLGIGQAATVRVGLAHGRRDLERIHRAGWSAFWLATAFMSMMSLIMVLMPNALISAFLDIDDPANSEVVTLAATYLLFAALFQIADGAQAVGGGMLRGLHDARVPMLYALAGYWGLGLPLGVILAFGLELGGTGIWIGLATGIAVVAVLMIHRWHRRERLGLLHLPG
ncbi:MAG: MATE family efflux transporter [Hyphomicrobiaceae bacterium]